MTEARKEPTATELLNQLDPLQAAQPEAIIEAQERLRLLTTQLQEIAGYYAGDPTRLRIAERLAEVRVERLAAELLPIIQSGKAIPPTFIEGRTEAVYAESLPNARFELRPLPPRGVATPPRPLFRLPNVALIEQSKRQLRRLR